VAYIYNYFSDYEI
jgi:hypothetical protein